MPPYQSFATLITSRRLCQAAKQLLGHRPGSSTDDPLITWLLRCPPRGRRRRRWSWIRRGCVVRRSGHSGRCDSPRHPDSHIRYRAFATLRRSARGLLLVSLLLWPAQSAAQSATNTTFGGRATVARARVATPPPLGPQSIVLSDTGDLDSTGGAKDATLLEERVPDLLSVRVLHASTVGQGQRSDSEASVADLSLTVGGNSIAADFLMARATAECKNGTASVGGSSEIVNLAVNGQTIVVSGQPNETIQVGPVTVIINEQPSSVTGKIVNALHVVVDGVADVVISSAHADVTCGGPVCPGRDFVTGGGWITTPSGEKGNFGVAGGIKNGALWGHLTYIDHGQNGPKVKGTGVQPTLTLRRRRVISRAQPSSTVSLGSPIRWMWLITVSLVAMIPLRSGCAATGCAGPTTCTMRPAHPWAAATSNSIRRVRALSGPRC